MYCLHVVQRISFFTASFFFSFYCVFVLWFVLLRLRNKKNIHTYIFVEEPGKTLSDWCENEWINYLNAKININRIFLSYNCDRVLNPFSVHYRSNYSQLNCSSFVNLSVNTLNLSGSLRFLISLQVWHCALFHFLTWSIILCQLLCRLPLKLHFVSFELRPE